MADGDETNRTKCLHSRLINDAREGDRRALGRLSSMVTALTELAYGELRPHKTLDSKSVRRVYIDAGSQHLLAEDGPVWTWDCETHGALDAYMIVTAANFFDSLRNSDGTWPKNPFAQGDGWTPKEVEVALDGRGRGGAVKAHRLAALVVDMCSVVARRVYGQSKPQPSDLDAKELLQRLVLKLYETPGSTTTKRMNTEREQGRDIPDPESLNGYVLRCWNPKKGRALRSWVVLIAEREAWAQLRTNSRMAQRTSVYDETDEPDSDVVLYEEVVMSVDQHRHIRQWIMKELGEDDVRLFDLVVSGHEPAKIAEILGIEVGAASQRKTRLRGRIRNHYPHPLPKKRKG